MNGCTLNTGYGVGNTGPEVGNVGYRGAMSPEMEVGETDPADAGPDLDWVMAQPYEFWGETRRSECPVIVTHETVMGSGTFCQITRFKDVGRGAP